MIPAFSKYRAAYLLDQLGVASIGAYGVRQLRAAYAGKCLQVRRSSDNTTQDIGFVSGYLDTSSLLSFVGSGNGFVSIWYDQSGNGNNATQTTTANQPQIVSSGSLVTANSKATLAFNGTSQFLNLPSGVQPSSANYSVGIVELTNNNNNNVSFGVSSTIGNLQILADAQKVCDNVCYSYNLPTSSLISVAVTHGSNMVEYVSNSAVLTEPASAGNSGNIASIGAWLNNGAVGTPGFWHSGDISEVVAFQSNLSSTQVGVIYASQHAFYGT